jgi:hypothetical protein
VILFVNWTFAPTTRAPPESITVPVIEPVTVCALAAGSKASSGNMRTTRFSNGIFYHPT